MESELITQGPALEELYARYLKDPQSVDTSWRHFFKGMEFVQEGAAPSKDLRVYYLIDAYRTYGHLEASFNPLESKPHSCSHLDLKSLGFSPQELEELFPSAGLLRAERAPLKEIIAKLREIYCGRIGVEYMGAQSPELEKWLQSKIEPTSFRPSFSPEQKREILHGLNMSELFEIFLHTKYVGQKRFSLEGGETLIPILEALLERGSELGMEELVIGMAHRGRLNVLSNILGKSYGMIFGEFEDYYDPALTEGAGDVKYHKGFSADIRTKQRKKIHIALCPNPSHLESVDPVALGKTYAKQIYRGDTEKIRTVPLLIHGDASLAGQGVVYESMQLFRLPGYATGGTVHIVINNQIGFTTLPRDSRSTLYCTDIARSFGAPVFHVNAEDPEGCVFAALLAIEIRNCFHCDVFIDMNCYRKYGHNEGDEPFFTQPLQYKTIRQKRSIREMYRDSLIQSGVVEKKIAEELEEQFKSDLHSELEELKLKKEVISAEAFGGIWKEYRSPKQGELFEPTTTAVDKETLITIANRFCSLPKEFNLHPKVVRLQEERLKMLEGSVDWAMGEHMAFGSLLYEGTPIRLAGQDCRRGTFSQRHACWVDQENGEQYIPLAHLKEGQGRFDVFDSPLSEYAALAFEFGYSLSFPSALVCWEAQFGDFANGGQIVIDQYIAPSEQKWLRYSGLTMLLPHGYEGQGPEHSSARIERFLQLAGSNNMQVCCPTTPAQYFHLLRRQVRRQIRKPLIVFTPKGLLRYAPCTSPLQEFTHGHFREVLDDPTKPTHATRLLFCSGRIYYDLIQERERRGANDVAIIRIEQLYPLHHDRMADVIKSYGKVNDYVWVQEEPRNMGAWHSLAPLLVELLPPGATLAYAGRVRSASPATGSHHMHVKEQKQLLSMAFGENA